MGGAGETAMGASTLISERDREVLRSFAQRIDPSDADAHNNLGVLYYQKGLHQEAVTAFTRALELDAKMQVAQRNLEVAYFSTGYYDRRVAALREQLRAAPDDRNARWELGRAYSLLGRFPEAVAEFKELLRHHPNDLGTMVQLGLAEKASGDLEEAQEWFERALALDLDSSVIHFYIGEVLYNRGLNAEALTALERVVARELLAYLGLAERETHRPASYPAASNSASPSRARSPMARGCCWRTSRPAISIRRPPTMSLPRSPRWSRRAASPR